MKTYWNNNNNSEKVALLGWLHSELVWAIIRIKGKKALLSFTTENQHSCDDINGLIPKCLKIISTCCSLVLSPDMLDITGFRWVVECELPPDGQ